MFPDGLLRIAQIASLPQFCLTESGAGWVAHGDVRLQLFALLARSAPQLSPASALQAVRLRSSRPKVLSCDSKCRSFSPLPGSSFCGPGVTACGGQSFASARLTLMPKSRGTLLLSFFLCRV